MCVQRYERGFLSCVYSLIIGERDVDGYNKPKSMACVESFITNIKLTILVLASLERKFLSLDTKPLVGVFVYTDGKHTSLIDTPRIVSRSQRSYAERGKLSVIVE
jgi:hypothetical protein